MSPLQPFSPLRSRRHGRLAVCAAIVVACLTAASTAHGTDLSQEIARKRAENERKSREIKVKAEQHRKEVEAQQNKTRARLGLPSLPSGSSAAPATAKSLPTPEDMQKKVDELRKKAKLPEGSTFSKSSPARPKRSPVEYSPKRGQEFAFLVEMTTHEGGLEKQWVGTPYFAGIYSDVRSSFAEMFCIGSLECRIRAASDRPWTPVSIEDIELPQRFMFSSDGVLNTQTTGLFDQHTLPLQLSAILPLEELIFPALPDFTDGRGGETKRAETFYLRGGQKNILGDTPTKTLNGESTRVRRIENETSSVPRIVNERSFQCPSQGIALSFRQTGNFDAGEGMIRDSDIDYRLELQGPARLAVKVRRLSGNDFATARAAALKALPRSQWPDYFLRVPSNADEFQIQFLRSARDVSRGQRVSVSIDINERSAHGSRTYLARVIEGAPDDKVRVRLDGSGEEFDVSPTSVRLPKG